MTTGERLRRVRRKMKMSQAKFGDLIGYGQPVVSEMERGIMVVPDRVLGFMAEQEKLLVPALPKPAEPKESPETIEGRTAFRQGKNVQQHPYHGHGDRTARRDFINGYFLEKEAA